MIPSSGENYKIKLYKRKENTPYEWQDAPSVIFKGRPADKIEVKNYRLLKGVNASEDNVFVFCTNLPKSVDIKDKIVFLGKEWTIESIGYYYSQNAMINESIMSDEYLISRCPKGLSLA